MTHYYVFMHFLTFTCSVQFRQQQNPHSAPRFSTLSVVHAEGSDVGSVIYAGGQKKRGTSDKQG